MNARLLASWAVLSVLLAGAGCVYGRGGRCALSNVDLKELESVIVQIDLNEGSLTLSQPHDRNIMAVVVGFGDTTSFWLDGKPASAASLKPGMTAEVEMRGRKMSR